MRKQKYIAIFDSGIGGFTALLNAVTLFPKESFLFYADTKNVPYGVKSVDEVEELTVNAVAEIAKYGVKAVVLACNTATSAAAAQLRGIYQFPVLGMEPAIKPALEATRSQTLNRVLLLCTPLTMQGGKLAENIRRIDHEQHVDCKPLPELVEFAEKMEFGGSRVMAYLKANVLDKVQEHYGAVVLGCTHFIWYKDLLKELLPAHIKLFDGNTGTLNNLRGILASRNEQATGTNLQREILLHFTGDIDEVKLMTLVNRMHLPVKVV